MKAYWSETRANGQPIERGTVCRVIDLEDGTHPIFIYGTDQEEIFRKLELQNMHAQAALVRRAAQPATGAAQAPPPPGPAAAPRRTISADQVMQATADLTNPAKSGEAVATLLEAATGIDPVEQARQNYARLAMEWEAETPTFYPHPGNRQLVGERAIRKAGGRPGTVTKAILNEAYKELEAHGLLFEKTEQPAADPNNPPPLSGFPGESQVQLHERPRGTRYATGARSMSFSAPQTAQTRALKYTEEQIRTMPETERRRVFNDPDYVKACEFYYSGASA